MEEAGQRGTITVLVPVVVGVILILGVVLLDVTALLSARFGAQTAADAAALAAAPVTFSGQVPPRAVAQRLAEANGAIVLWCRCGVDRRPIARVVSVKTERVARLWLWQDIKVSAVARAEFFPYSEQE